MNEERNSLLIVGSIAFDSVETPAGGRDKALGGSAVYAAMAAGYFTRPRVVGVVGEDFGREHFELLEAHGVDTRGIERAEGETFHWKGRYHDNFKDRDTLSTCLNVFESFEPKIPREYRDSGFVFLGNIDPKLQARVLQGMNEVEFCGMDTMNFWIRNTPAELARVFPLVDLLFINDEETLELSGKQSLLDAARDIRERGPKYLVVKRGEFGALLFSSDFKLFAPAVLLPSIKDPTGAGDTFAGGFMGFLASNPSFERRNLHRALLVGAAMASFAVEEFSVDGLMNLDRDRIDSRIAELERMLLP